MRGLIERDAHSRGWTSVFSILRWTSSRGASVLSLHLPADLVDRIIGMNVIRLATVLVACLLSATAFAQTRADVCGPDVYEAVKRHLQIADYQVALNLHPLQNRQVDSL
jgi:hypothetical protein